jgi:hypothetical protein
MILKLLLLLEAERSEDHYLLSELHSSIASTTMFSTTTYVLKPAAILTVGNMFYYKCHPAHSLIMRQLHIHFKEVKQIEMSGPFHWYRT